MCIYKMLYQGVYSNLFQWKPFIETLKYAIFQLSRSWIKAPQNLSCFIVRVCVCAWVYVCIMPMNQLVMFRIRCVILRRMVELCKYELVGVEWVIPVLATTPVVKEKCETCIISATRLIMFRIRSIVWIIFRRMGHFRQTFHKRMACSQRGMDTKLQRTYSRDLLRGYKGGHAQRTD